MMGAQITGVRQRATRTFSLPFAAAVVVAAAASIAVWSAAVSCQVASAAAPTYSASVLADKPLVYYHFDERAGPTAFDSSGNGLEGAYQGGVTYDVPGAPASESNNWAISSTGLAVTGSAASLPAGNSARTMEFWLAGGRQNPIAFTYGGMNGVNDQFRVEVFAGELRLTTDAMQPYGSAQYAVGLPQAWWDGHWHLFDITYDGATALAYMDGQLVGSFGVRAPLATITALGEQLRIGDRPNLGYGDGAYDLDEFAVYPTALTAAQIDAHWSLGGTARGVCAAAPTTPYAQSVVKDSPSVYFRLGDLVSDSTHDVAFDSSGHCSTEAPTNGAIVPSNNYPGLPHGALAAGDDGAIEANNLAVTQSGTSLPAGNSSRTMEFWLAGGRQNPISFTYGGEGGTNDQFRVQVFAGQLWLTVDSSHSYESGQYAVSLPQAWWDGRWHLFDITYDGTTALAYMDGQLVGSFGVLSPLATVTDKTPLRLGERSDAGGENYGDGAFDLDEFAVYPAALTATQISRHWSLGGSARGVCASAPTTPYAQSVVKDSPSVYFRLGDLVSDSTHYVAFDSSGHCSSEAPTNGAIVPSNNYPGLPHGALAAGDDGAIEANNLAVTQSGSTLPAGNSARTMEFWLAGGRQNPIAFTYGGEGGTNDQFRVQVFAGQLWLTVDSSHSYESAQYAVSLPQAWWDSRWHLFDITYDGTTALAYMDGQLVGSFGVLSPLATVTGKTPLRLGERSDAGGENYGDGAFDLDEFAVYPAALTATQIDAHWSLGGSSRGACAAVPTTPYAQSVVKDAPSVYFRLGDLVSDSTHDVAFDSSGHCSTEAPTNGAIVPSNNYPGLPHGALATGDDGAIEANNLAVTQSGTSLPAGNSARTMEFWLAGGRQNPIAFAYGGEGGTNDQFRVQVFAGQLWLTVDGGRSYESAQYAVSLPQAWWDGRWHLFDITYDGTTALAYMDGQLVGNFGVLSPLATVTGKTPLHLGEHSDANGENYGDGAFDLDEFAVYPTALTAAQIDEHWSIGEPVPSVASISPTTGPTTGGTTVEIKGTGFVAGASVSFGGTASASTTVVSPTEIRVVSPAGSGTVDVQVTTGGGTSPAVPADNYSYVAVPPAAPLSPSPDPVTGGQPTEPTGTTSPTDGGTSTGTSSSNSAPSGQDGTLAAPGPTAPSSQNDEPPEITGATPATTTPQAGALPGAKGIAPRVGARRGTTTGIATVKGRRGHPGAPRQADRRCADHRHAGSRQTCEHHGNTLNRKQ